ncbi:MAG: UDP-glucuronic acid decarboxylase family protein [Candidatus Dormiibacterota bacterium]
MTWAPSRVVVTGGAGFLGSHLVDRLLAAGAEVICVDNLITGSRRNNSHLVGDPRFSFHAEDVSGSWSVDGPVDAVLHFASLASPVDYLRHPLETLEVGTLGTLNALRIAQDKGARFLLASTSEVYGDPLVHPQPETYWGNVNPVGPRSVYDESKRAAEAFAMAFSRARGVEVRIARIFNTFGPRMREQDGRAVPQFVTQALAGTPITVYGDGSQTRSLCYVDDLMEGLMRLLGSDYPMPVNLGNPHEVTMLELAELVREICSSKSVIELQPLPVDDPKRRCPDVTVARRELDWQAAVSLDDGLRRTVSWWCGERVPD